MSEIKITRSLENYLIGIYDILKDQPVVQVGDLAARLDVKPPSVVKAVTKLEEMQLVIYERRRHIDLTPQGREIAEAASTKRGELREILAKTMYHDPDGAALEELEELHNELPPAPESAAVMRCVRTREPEKSVELHDETVADRRMAREVTPRGPDKQQPLGLQRASRRMITRQRKQPPTPDDETKLFACTLSQLTRGQTGKVARIIRSFGLRSREERLMGMGFSKGQQISVQRVSEAGSRMAVIVGEKAVLVDAEDAASIVVDVEN